LIADGLAAKADTASRHKAVTARNFVISARTNSA
jgi:hypothetical protein